VLLTSLASQAIGKASQKRSGNAHLGDQARIRLARDEKTKQFYRTEPKNFSFKKRHKDRSTNLQSKENIKRTDSA